MAAQLAGVDPRTVSRWAANGVLVKYRGARGDVQFDRQAVIALRKEPADRQARPEPRDETTPHPMSRSRW